MAEPKKKRGRGRPKNPDSKRAQGVDRHANPRRSFHAPAELFERLEGYIKATKPAPSEAEVMRTALDVFLVSKGF